MTEFAWPNSGQSVQARVTTTIQCAEASKALMTVSRRAMAITRVQLIVYPLMITFASQANGIPATSYLPAWSISFGSRS